MGFRTAELVARCAVCKEPATHECVRCNKPLCDDHGVEAEERCPACEADYDHRTQALTKPAPKKLQGAFSVAVGLPSVGFGVLAAVVTLIAGLFGGAGLSVFPLTAGAFLIGAAMGLFLTLPLYFLIGTPIFARRKLHGPIQSIRRFFVRRKFLEERKKLDSKPAPKQIGDGS